MKSSLRHLPKPLISYILSFIFVYYLFLTWKICEEVLFGYFIISEYIAARATSFISLDAQAGICREVPAAVTGLYSLDTNGHWSGDELYDPSSAIYSFRMNDFLKSTEEYRTYISEQKLILNFPVLGLYVVAGEISQSARIPLT